MRRLVALSLFVSVALVFSLSAGLHAQKIDASFNPTSGVLPHSPEAGTLIKFVEVPVSPYTGLPEVTIPLATVSEHRLSVPVSLSYHGGGHRVSEIANWVGLGWKLNAGGMITRKVRGLPDDTKRGQGFLQFRQQYGYDDLVGWLQAQDEVKFQSLAAGCWDTEPDEYFFELNGVSGKFAFDWEGDLPKVSSPDGVKILSFQQGTDRTITEWKLAGPDGVVFTFSALETTEVYSEFSLSAICTSGWQTFVSAWYVSRIEDPNRPGQQILFDYDSYRIDQDWTGFETRAYASASNPASCGGGFSGSSSYALSRVTINGKRVKNIRAASGHQKLRFDALTLRTDVNSSFAASPDLYRLDDIVLLGASGQTLSSYHLDYTYQGRLMLASIQPRGADGQAVPAYQFAYNQKSLPPVNSKAIDHWGFYNGVNNATLLPEYVHRLAGNSFVYFPGADRKPTLEFAQAAVLEKVTYPTGGSVELAYELNEYSYIGAQSVASQQEYVQHPQSAALTATGNLSNSNWVEVEKSFSVESMETSVLATVFVNGSTWATFAGQVYLPQARILKADGTQVASFSLNVGEASDPPPYVQQLPARTLLLAPGDYKIKAKARKYITAQGTDTITVQVFWTEAELADPVLRKPAGGLRVKQIRSKDANGTVANLRTYRYEMDTPAGYSSGVVYGEPIYVYQATSLDSQGNECSYVQLVGSSRVALGSTSGSHIGYRRVVERFGAAGEGGSNVFEYTSPFEYTDALNTVKPFKDPTSNSFKTGLLKRQRTYDAQGTPVSEVSHQYEFTQTDLPSVKVSLGKIAPPAYFGDNFYQAIYLGSAYAAYPFEDKFAFAFSPYRMGFARIKATTEVLDGVSKTTTFGYDPAGRHHRPVSVSFKNSDNKTYRTDSKTAHEANVGCMLAENMVAAPVEERSFVDDQLTGGWRVQYGNDGFGGCQPLKYFEILHDGTEVQRAEVLEYDASGYLKRVRKSGFPEQKLTWQNGLLTLWEYGSTGAGVVKQVRQYAYEPNSRQLKQLTDIDGQVKEFSYDGFQRLRQTKVRGGNVVSDTAYQYGNPNRVTTTATATGAPAQVSEQTYDGLGRPLKTTLNGVLKKEIIYDGLGRVWKQTHLPGNFVRFAYDGSPLNRVVEKFYPDGSAVLTDFGAAGTYRFQSVTDENDNESATVSDLLGRVVSVRNALGKSTFNHYDLRGNLVRVVPPMGSGPQYEHRYTYDKRNRLTGKKVPGADWQSFVYDDATDLVKKSTDGLGRVLEFDYDALGRQKAVRLNGATIAATAYDTGAAINVGKVVSTQAKVLNGTKMLKTDYTYDGFGRLWKLRADNHLDGQDLTTHTYNHADWLLTTSREHLGWGKALSIVKTRKTVQRFDPFIGGYVTETNPGYRPYPDRSFSRGGPTYLGERFEYWQDKGVDLLDVYRQGFGDKNHLFSSGSSDNGSQAMDRFSQGQAAARSLIEQIENGDVTLGPEETIKIVGHSQGAAFAAGMAWTLANNEKYAGLLEAVHYIAPHQPGDFYHPATIPAVQFSTMSDLVSSSHRLTPQHANPIMLANGGSSYAKIPGVLTFIERGYHKGGRRGHSAWTYLDSITTYFRSLGVPVTVRN